MNAKTTDHLMAELRAVAREAEELLQATADQTGARVEELRERAKDESIRLNEYSFTEDGVRFG